MQDYIGWIIGAIVLGMAAWPIMHIVPSAAQKRQIAFRIKAQSLGMQVQLRRTKLPQELKSQYQHIETATCYFLPELDSELDGTFTAIRSQNAHREWFWIHQHPTAQWINKMLVIYDALPDNILAVEQSRNGSAIYWYEKGELEAVTDVFERLQEMNKILIR